MVCQFQIWVSCFHYNALPVQEWGWSSLPVALSGIKSEWINCQVVLVFSTNITVGVTLDCISGEGVWGFVQDCRVTISCEVQITDRCKNSFHPSHIGIRAQNFPIIKWATCSHECSSSSRKSWLIRVGWNLLQELLVKGEKNATVTLSILATVPILLLILFYSLLFGKKKSAPVVSPQQFFLV